MKKQLLWVIVFVFVLTVIGSILIIDNNITYADDDCVCQDTFCFIRMEMMCGKFPGSTGGVLGFEIQDSICLGFICETTYMVTCEVLPYPRSMPLECDCIEFCDDGGGET